MNLLTRLQIPSLSFLVVRFADHLFTARKICNSFRTVALTTVNSSATAAGLVDLTANGQYLHLNVWTLLTRPQTNPLLLQLSGNDHCIRYV